MQPFFSVIIPTYNRANFIGKAIESLLAQTFAQWELVIVDDGSTDNTKEIVQSYKDPRINYVFQKNAERCAARNNGIEKALGKYICFLDSDDYYLPERLDLLYNEIMSRNSPEAVFYTGLLFDKDGVLNSRNEKNQNVDVFNHLIGSVIHSQQVCIHHRILKHFRYDTRFHIGEDTELWLRIATQYPFLYLAHQHTIVVLEHEARSINIKHANVFAEQLRMFNHVFSSSHSGVKILRSKQRQLISACYFGMAKYFIYQNDKHQAIKNLCWAVLKDPTNGQTKYRLNIMRHLFFSIETAKQLL